EDPYAWLRERENPDTLAYLEAENAFAAAWFEPLAEIQTQIFEEIKRRTLETDLTVPVPKGPWRYYTRTVEGMDYPIHCRAPRDSEAGEETLLDENAEHERLGGDYFAIGAFDVSPSHGLLAWSHDQDGGEEYTLRIRDLATGAELADT